MGLNENSKRYDGLERPSETCFEVSDGLFYMGLFRRSQDACLVQQEQNGKAGQINQTDNGEEVHAHGQFVAFVAFDEAVVQPSEHWGGNESGNHGEFEQLGHCAVEPENHGQA